MNFSSLNTIQPCLISASQLNEHNCYHAGDSYGERTVEHYELDYVVWGEGHILTDGIRIPATKGSLFFRSPGMVVEGIAPYYCYFIVFDIFPDITSSNSGLAFPTVMNVSNTSYMEDLFSGLYTAYIAQGEVSQFITRAYIMQILLDMYGQWTTKSMYENMRSSLRKHYGNILAIREQIEKSPHMAYTLEQLVEMSDLSKYYFCRIFRKLIGDSPIDFINRCRINNAKRLLTETDKSVKEIMFLCGFENESHFFRLFKSFVKVSPAAYRQNSRSWIKSGSRVP